MELQDANVSEVVKLVKDEMRKEYQDMFNDLFRFEIEQKRKLIAITSSSDICRHDYA